ncbi:galactokinase [uncultured Polaribacter sp.]|uniref:galactokinase n=1 Tax=uncultured Polaribacter sp. TaxID=174711 RepID=UPI002620A465|nr:galactokinase [uncultured Polaribacter sp.]
MSTTLIKDVKETFIKEFNTEPLLIFSPGRINIIGEHTDYNDGFVFPAAVNKGIAAAVQKSDSGSCTAIALDLDSTIKFELNKLKPSKEGSWENYVFGVVAEIQNRNKIIGDFNIIFKGNIPGGAGMSSSAALENSVVFGLNELFDLGLTKHEMILISQKAEHNYVGVNCGIMDQYASMFGIKDNALHLDCRTVESKPYKIDFKDHQLMLINTNVKHSLSDSAYNYRRSACESISELLGIKALRDATEADLETVIDKVTPSNYQKALYIIQENARTIKAAKAIENNDLELLGSLIYQSHAGLSDQYKVSCEELDFLVTQAKKNKHILGARMMGGGFGGCTINLIANTEAKSFAETVSKAYKNKFGNECSVYFIELSEGTHIVK